MFIIFFILFGAYMPYITFSKNFPNQARLAKMLKSKSKNSIIEPRGTKSLDKVIEIAAFKGFNNVIVVMKDKDNIIALKIISKRLKNGLSWDLKKSQKLKNIEEVLKIK